MVRIEAEAEALRRSYAVQCQRAAAEFVGKQTLRLEAAAASSVSGGSSLGSLSGEFAGLARELRDRAAGINVKLDALGVEASRREAEYRRLRERQSAFSRLSRARLLIGALRRAARESLTALGDWHQRLSEKIELSALAQAHVDLADAVTRLAQGHTVTPILNGTSQERIASWRGQPLPTAEEVRIVALQRARSLLPRLRSSVLASLGRNQPADEAVQDAARDLFAVDKPWPATIAQYLAGLNGQLRPFVDRLVKDATEWLLSDRTPGVKRHRKVFLVTADGSDSAIYQSMKERLPDTAGVVAIEHAEDELLVISEERLLTLGEVQEARACLQAFRDAPHDRRSAIVTAVEDADEIINYYPDRPSIPQKARQLLATGVALGIIRRSGSHDYQALGSGLAKGYQAAEEALRLDQRLAGEIGAAVVAATTDQGTASIVARLTAAKNSPASLVPKGAVPGFRRGLAEAIAEFDRGASSRSN
jgi:hypothetical protein